MRDFFILSEESMTMTERINKLDKDIAEKYNFRFNEDGTVVYTPKPEQIESIAYYNNRLNLGNGNYKKLRHAGAE